MWNITEDYIQANDLENVCQLLANQVEDSPLFLKIMTNLCQSPKEESNREFQLKCGKIIELYAHPRYLNNNVIGTVFSFRDISNRKELEIQLLHQATHDTLTDLPNRALLLDRIQQGIALAKRQSLSVAVLIFDLDHFKKINDSLGHNAGDILLKIVAKKLQSYVRSSDTAARLGGDEFVLVITSTAEKDNLISKINGLLKLFQ
jgi:predicted signal transduction protein with EAL and GGDEF domain